jgi:DNA-binding transcriptional LysR family regulator
VRNSRLTSAVSLDDSLNVDGGAIAVGHPDGVSGTRLTGHALLSYQTAPYRKSKKIRYVLEDFESEPVPVQIIYPHTRRLSTTVRAFVDECVRKLRHVSLD